MNNSTSVLTKTAQNHQEFPMTSIRFLPLVDTHAHINLEDFQPDLEDLLKRSLCGRLPEIKGRQFIDPILRPFTAGIICPGIDLQSSITALEISKRFECVFAAIGFHPNHTGMIQPGEWEQHEELVINTLEQQKTNSKSVSGKIVALGETGLDRYWDVAPFELQSEYFIKTLKFGRKVQLPVIIHSREANDELMDILQKFFLENPKPKDYCPGVVHSFSGTLEQAEKLIQMGFYLGFGGFVTYANKKFSALWKVAQTVPIDRILLETDSPFLTPHPLRGKLERNEPLTTAFVARRLAELRETSTTEIVEQTTQNAIRLFNLPELSKAPINLSQHS